MGQPGRDGPASLGRQREEEEEEQTSPFPVRCFTLLFSFSVHAL